MTTSVNERRIAQLLDRQSILDVIYQRARASDRRDVELARLCYHEGATEDHEGFKGSAELFLAQSQIGESSKVPTMYHFIGNVIIAIDGDDAKAESYVIAIAETNGDHPSDVIVASRYLDEFQRRDGVWAIVHRQLVFDWSRVEDPGSRYWDFMGFDMASLPMGTCDVNDPLYRLFDRTASSGSM